MSTFSSILCLIAESGKHELPGRRLLLSCAREAYLKFSGGRWAFQITAFVDQSCECEDMEGERWMGAVPLLYSYLRINYSCKIGQKVFLGLLIVEYAKSHRASYGSSIPYGRA